MGRKTGKAACLIFVWLTVLCTGAGCGDGAGQTAQGPTDRLTLYGPPFCGCWMDPAKEIYMQQHPDVEIDYRDFSGPPVADIYQDTGKIWEIQQDYSDLLTAELTAGRGPDFVLFSRDLFPDLYKVLDAGVFCDLEPFFAADASFDPSAYLMSVLDGGVYHGQRLFVPLMYQSAYYIADGKTLESAGFSLSDRPTYPEWSAQIKRYLQTHTQTENLRFLYELNMRFTFQFWYSGLQVLDYETGALLIDDENFRSFLEFYQEVYPYYQALRDKPFLFSSNALKLDVLFALQKGDKLFHLLIDDSQLYDACFRNGNLFADVRFPFPRYEGAKSVARGSLLAAVNAASPNKQNAYDFLKILLSVSLQRTMVSPVQKDAIRMQVSEAHFLDLQGENASGFGFTDGVEYCRNDTEQPLALVYQCMEPYFQRQKPYEACLDELRGRLEIYLHE